MRFPVQRHNEAFIEFLGEKCDQVKKPLIVRTAVREYRSRGSDRTEESLVHCAYRYKLKVREIADEKKRARQLFALSVPVDEELMGKLEKHARVVLDKNNLITEYCSHDGSLILKGDQSQSNRMKNALAEFRKARETNIDDTEKEDNLPGLNPPVPKKPRVTEPWNNLGNSPAGSYTPQASQLTGSRYSSSQAPCALVQQGKSYKRTNIRPGQAQLITQTYTVPGSVCHVRQFGRTQNTFGVSSGTSQTSRNQFVAPGQLRFAVRATQAQTPPKENMPPLVDNHFKDPTANIRQEISEEPSLEVVPIRNGHLGISADNRPGQGQPTAQTIKATSALIQQGKPCKRTDIRPGQGHLITQTYTVPGSVCHVRQFGRTQNTFGVSSGTSQTSRNQFVAPGQLRFAVRATQAQTPPKENMPPLVDNQFKDPTANIKQEIPENPSLEVVPIRNGRLGISADNRPGQGQPTAQTIKATSALIQQGKPCKRTDIRPGQGHLITQTYTVPGSVCHVRQFGRTHNTFGVSSGTPQTSRNPFVLLLPEEPGLDVVPISNENMDNSADNRPGQGQLTTQTINAPESVCQLRQFGRSYNTFEFCSGRLKVSKNQSVTTGQSKSAATTTQAPAAPERNMGLIKAVQVKANIKRSTPQEPTLEVDPKNGDLEITAVVKPERHNNQEQRPPKNEPPRKETLTLATQKKLLESISTLIQVMELPFDFQNLEEKIQLITGYGRLENNGRPELKKVELRKLLIALEYSFINLQEDSENVKNENVRSLKMYMNHLLFVIINVRMPGFDPIKTQVKELLDEVKDADVMIPVPKILASMRIFIDALIPKYVLTAIN